MPKPRKTNPARYMLLAGGKRYFFDADELDDTLFEGEAWDTAAIRRRVRALGPGESMKVGDERLVRLGKRKSDDNPAKPRKRKPAKRSRARAKVHSDRSSSTRQNEKSKRTRVDNPRAPGLGELGTCTEIGRVHELQVELPNGEVQSHAWRGRHPLLMWSPTKRALVFAYGGKLGRPKRGDVPRDDGAAATSERFEGKRATYWRENLVPKVSLRELGRARIIAYRGPRWRGRVAEHKLGPQARAWMGTSGARKVYVVAGGNLRLTGAGIEG